MAYGQYLKTQKEKGTELKVFLNDSKKTMLQGKITDFDEDCIVLDKCLIMREHIISISPQ